jgi:hypothetical protein
MKKLKQNFFADKEIWYLRLYFIVCILIAIILCKYFGNVFGNKESIGGGISNVLLFTALLLFIGGYCKGFYQRIKTKR